MKKEFEHINAMVVDDSLAILDFVSAMLKDYGIENVVKSHLPVRAITQINELKINLLFLDLNMPELDGIEFLKRLVDIQYSGKLVIMSGVAPRIVMSVEDLIKNYKLDWLGTMLKPLDHDEFKRVMERLGNVKANKKAVPNLHIYEIIRAIDANDLVVLYQPQVDLHTHRIYGVEALVRINHPRLGLVSPDQFLSKIEESELMLEITRRVIEIAIKNWVKWRKYGYEFKLSINASPTVLQQHNFTDYFFDILNHYVVPANMITIEVTETTLANDFCQELATLGRLSMRGIDLAIDDFGQEHASIERLQSLPLNILKLDKSVFLEEKHTHTQMAIIQSSVAMAKQLQLKVIAEGIEKANHWRLAADLGCDVAQGYYLSRPIAAKDIVPWIQSWQRQIA